MKENLTALVGKSEPVPHPDKMFAWCWDWLHARLGYVPTQKFVLKVMRELERREGVIVIVDLSEL